MCIRDRVRTARNPSAATACALTGRGLFYDGGRDPNAAKSLSDSASVSIPAHTCAPALKPPQHRQLRKHRHIWSAIAVSPRKNRYFRVGHSARRADPARGYRIRSPSAGPRPRPPGAASFPSAARRSTSPRAGRAPGGQHRTASHPFPRRYGGHNDLETGGRLQRAEPPRDAQAALVGSKGYGRRLCLLQHIRCQSNIGHRTNVSSRHPAGDTPAAARCAAQLCTRTPAAGAGSAKLLPQNRKGRPSCRRPPLILCA